MAGLATFRPLLVPVGHSPSLQAGLPAAPFKAATASNSLPRTQAVRLLRVLPAFGYASSKCRLHRRAGRGRVSSRALAQDSGLEARTQVAATVCLTAATVLAVLAGAVLVTATNPVDVIAHTWVSEALSLPQRQGIDSASNLLDDFGQLMVWATSALLLSQGKFESVAGPAGLQAVRATYKLLKPGIHRMRPSADILTDFSFPSAHTSRFVFCFVMVSCVILPRLADPDGKSKPGMTSWTTWLLAFATAWALMGSCRVLADAHWVSDTFGGALLGTAMASFLDVALVFFATQLRKES